MKKENIFTMARKIVLKMEKMNSEINLQNISMAINTWAFFLPNWLKLELFFFNSVLTATKVFYVLVYLLPGEIIY